MGLLLVVLALVACVAGIEKFETGEQVPPPHG
jgi:hypothetical protein